MSIIGATISLLFLFERNMATTTSFTSGKIERVGRDSPPSEKSLVPNEYSNDELKVFTDRFGRRLNLLQSQCAEIPKNGLRSTKSMGKVIPEANSGPVQRSVRLRTCAIFHINITRRYGPP